MTKADVKDFASLEAYARDRAKRSAYRNDPVAAAYWLATAMWAAKCAPTVGTGAPFKSIRDCIRFYAEDALRLSTDNEPMLAALTYSRAKWCMFMERNNGRPVSPKQAGMGLGWLRKMVGL